MKRLLLSLSLLLVGALLSARAEPAAPVKRDDSAAEKLGWHLASKGYTFRAITLFEAIEISQRLGVKYYEMNPTQKMSPEHPVNTDASLPPELRAEVKKKFAAAGIQPVSFGVMKLTKDETADRKVFEYVKEMGIQTIVSEPDAETITLLDKLCDEYKINVAIHNHPQPSHYWNPQTVLDAIQGHNPRIGSCADVGHWTRSGLVAADCLRELQGHIIQLHFKDVNDEKKDVVWGTGRTDVKAMLAELHRQKFQGIFSMEYESSSGAALVDELRQSIEYFDAEAGRIAAGH